MRRLAPAGIIEAAYRSRRVAAPARPSGLEPGRSLVTGATGFIGSRLVERLFDDGSTGVTGIVRRPQTCASVARFPIELSVGDLLDSKFVARTSQGKRFVFHLAYGRDGPDAEAITVQGTKNVVNGAIAAGCEAVVVLSTVNVFGWPDGEVDETAPYRPAGGQYGRSKSQMERWCLRRAGSSGKTRIVLILPSSVYGPGGKTFTELPAKLASDGAFAWISEGRGLANYVYIDNLIDAILLAASNTKAHGQRFIVNDGWSPWSDFLGPIVKPWDSHIGSYEPGELRRLAADTRRGAMKRALSAAASNPGFRQELKQSLVGPVATSLATMTRSFARRGPGRPVVMASGSPSASPTQPPEWIAELFGAHNTRFSARNARARLGWTPRVGLAQGQSLAVDYLKTAGLHPTSEPRPRD